jgi:hypothetical protein
MELSTNQESPSHFLTILLKNFVVPFIAVCTLLLRRYWKSRLLRITKRIKYNERVYFDLRPTGINC